MVYLRRLLAAAFFFLILLTGWQCARRGSPTGGPKDTTPPELIRSDPENFSLEFDNRRIRLFFDEYIKLNNIQDQLIISPPLKNQPQISPQGVASKSIEVTIKDTLLENTTYTLNFGQSIVDNNEGNPNSFLTYVFSTGDYIDSLTVKGEVRDAFNQNADEFISVMLYRLDSTYTDSTIYKQPPYYLTNTLDSATTFELQNLKEGKYLIRAVKDEGKNNLFDPNADKIGFLNDTLELPTDTSFVLTLFKEIPYYNAVIPTLASGNRIIFGFSGPPDHVHINPLSKIPDTVRILVYPEPEKDTLNYWFTPFERDSLVFEIYQDQLDIRDTFTVKTRSLPLDSLVITASHRGKINFEDKYTLSANIPVSAVDTAKFFMMDQDSVIIPLTMSLDSVYNRLAIDFTKEANTNYRLNVFPGAITDFFGNTNDTLNLRLSTASYADYGNLRLRLSGDVNYPLIVQLTDDKEVMVREIFAREPRVFEFRTIDPGKYLIRLILDANGNGEWDTGNYLKNVQPERVIYYPKVLEVRANWELEETFTVEY
ncbi:Ig-like domain-containing protein [Lentiprolixibacter aurantiacus]|uniref:Ig-like domain-containing protein n=1 Tax=Lentiprolixibacter aurantiacus TaxID=2993939 RepID=A0AAE3MJL3_9FLAO|nr:Ig-like domain-containing protein [Lentiprolixibacter aurantiacus]MCX2718312.1 Ig-like domain-containing protein [Lentiprolixibacter aurantiacus]